MLVTRIACPLASEALSVLEEQCASAVHDIMVSHSTTILHPEVIVGIDQTVIIDEWLVLVEADASSDTICPLIDP